MGRLGNFTASEIHKLFTQPRSKYAKENGEWSDTSKTYIFEKAVESLTGYRKQWTNKAVEHGNFNEEEAMQVFKDHFGVDVTHQADEYIPINDNCGATPDGIIYESFDKALAVVDVKCPYNPMSFFEQKVMIQDNKNEDFQCVPKPYFYQMQMQMMAAKCDKAYLVRYLTSSFTDDFGNKYEFDLPIESRIFVSIINRDEDVCLGILSKVSQAVATREEIKNKLLQTL